MEQHKSTAEPESPIKEKKKKRRSEGADATPKKKKVKA